MDGLVVRHAPRKMGRMNMTPAEREAHFGDLPLEEERRLIELWQKHGDVRARDRLIMAYQHIVRPVAKRWARDDEYVSYDELMQQGMLGLMRAADKHDSEKGRFGAFATYFVKGEIFKICFSLRHPGTMDYAYRKVLIGLKKARQKLGYADREIDEPGYKLLAEEMGVDVKLVRLVVHTAFSTTNVADFYGSRRHESLIYDPEMEEEADVETTGTKLKREWIQKAYAKLDDRERAVLNLSLERPRLRARRQWKQMGEQLGFSPGIAKRADDLGRRKIRNFFIANLPEIRRSTGVKDISLDFFLG